MRDDLLDAYAGIEWAESQLKVLEGRIEAWTKLPPYEIREEINPKRPEKFYKLSNVRPLPAIINAEAGMIINSLRSSLDLLANTLAARKGHADPKHTQFPISPSEYRFRHGKHPGRKELSPLLPADQKVIEDLKPWAGGHPHLFDLHTLDIVRKHRKLIDVMVLSAGMSIGNIDQRSGFRADRNMKGFENDSLIGRTNIDAPKPDLDIILAVVLAEGRAVPAPGLLETLHKFGRSTAAIIELFDGP